MRCTTLFLTSLFLFSALAADEEIPPAPAQAPLSIHLKDPLFKEGVLTTDQGGVVSAQGLRIQAKKIVYTDRIENGIAVKKIVAKGDLLMEFGGKAFTGKELEFDLISKSGALTHGKTYIDVWFIGGEKIELKSDGTYQIHNAYITTSESQDTTWDIHAAAVRITKEHLLAANNIRFRFLKIPIMWFPSFKANLDLFKDPPVRYKIIWDKWLGPRITMRYRLYSWEDFNLFFRLDYRIKRGPGSAIETEYYSKDQRTVFVTKSYAAYDQCVPDEHGRKRYRFQGLWDHASLDDQTHVHMTYDKLHDHKMPGDFKSEEFEINTQKETIFTLHHQEDKSFALFKFRPRINSFQSLNQEIPLLHLGIKPFPLANTGIISQNNSKAAFLDYVYDKNLANELHSRHAVRLETKNQLYRPFYMGPLTWTPNAGIIAIFYNNNPQHRSIGQAVATYGFDLNTRLSRAFGQQQHHLEPYFRYEGLSTPLANPHQVIIFNIQDGYTQFNALRMGVRNYFYTATTSCEPSFSADFFTYAFFHNKRIPQTFPKAYTSLAYHRPSFALYSTLGWNFQQNLLDYFTIRPEWTVNQNVAFAVEYRHRSRFDWRKSNHENFIVDSYRSIDQMLHSPMSDRRDTLLSRVYLQISPRWGCKFESHCGWGRKHEPSYQAERLEFSTNLTTAWRLRFGIENTPNDFRFIGGFSLIH